MRKPGAISSSRFSRPSPGAQGTGLGLATIYGIVKQSGGDIWVSSDPGEGTGFQIYLPAVSESAERAAPVAREVSPGGSETILLVEDDEAVRRLAARLLESAGYRVLPAANAAEAAEIAGREGREVRLLVSDVILPGASGPQLAESLRVAHPSLKVLFMSGYTDTAIVHRDLFAPGTAFLQKPFTPGGLMRKVREVLDPVPPPDA